MDRLEEIDGLIMLYFHSKIDGEITDIAVETMNEHVEWMVDTIRDQQATIDSLSMAHDAIYREMPKDKHTLIKNVIGLNKRVQELENENDILNQSLADVTGASGFMIKRVEEQNKRYRATINAMRQILKDAIHSLDVGEKVQGLEYGVKMANEALEGEEIE